MIQSTEMSYLAVVEVNCLFARFSHVACCCSWWCLLLHSFFIACLFVCLFREREREREREKEREREGGKRN